MKILVIGGGGREHAVCWAIKKIRPDVQIFCAPGNAGISEIARCIQIKPTEVNDLIKFADYNSIDLTFVGGEDSLAAGIVDAFEKGGFKIIGPNASAARLESSKVFAKQFMLRHKIPTAHFQTAESADEALQILNRGEFGDAESPIVIKADGLAAGKGVIVAANRFEAQQAIKELMIDKTAGATAAQQIVLEEKLAGREVSLLLFSDGKNFALMPAARDHKRIGEGDVGPNTGGMGAITDKSLLGEDDLRKIIDEIVVPTLAGAEFEKFSFRGVLFLGLMMTPEGAKVLEYNVRFGDPEAQSILVRLKSDFVEICESIAERRLNSKFVEFSAGSSACVIMAARGYPSRPETGDLIKGLEKAVLYKNAIVFHAGTRKNENGEFLTAGGRVLGITAWGENLSVTLERSFALVSEIHWNGVQYRRDIGAT